ncbi:MAG TPA: hypothetical protein DEP42_07535 [Ruminococcaceae bacterium]|nr:hypothetical protein [Oscillospiraceae bacterium]
MEKKSYVSPGQITAMLLTIRLLFLTPHLISLHAGHSLQDILPAVIVAYFLNFLLAAPMLLLLNRHQGKDLIECADASLGNGTSKVIALLYFLYLGLYNILVQNWFCSFFIDAVNSATNSYAILIPLFVIIIYGACKGFESISRFATIVFILFFIMIILLLCTLIPSISTPGGIHLFFPLFYNGPNIFLKEILNQMNSNSEIIALGICMSFVKSGHKSSSIFFKYNSFAHIVIFILLALCVAVLGPFGSVQNFPLQTMASESVISVFERLDSLYNMSWVLTTILHTVLYTFLQAQCLTKMGLNRHRKIAITIIAVLNFLGVLVVRTFIPESTNFTANNYISVINLFAILILPFIILMGDLFKGRSTKHEMA